MKAALVSSPWLFLFMETIMDAQQVVRAGVPSFFTRLSTLRNHMCYISSTAIYMWPSLPSLRQSAYRISTYHGFESPIGQNQVADQHAFNHCDGVCPGPGLYHVVRVSPPVPLKACGGAYGGVVVESVEDLMLSTSMARQKD
jgi:hypothetical protein